MLIFDTETLARELGLPKGIPLPEAEAYFKASPGNNYFSLTKGSKAEDEAAMGRMQVATDKALAEIDRRMEGLRLHYGYPDSPATDPAQ